LANLGVIIMLDQMMKMLEGQQIGSYRLNKFLGAGSFGGVFHGSEMVRNTSVQEVAIKVIPESSDDKLIMHLKDTYLWGFVDLQQVLCLVYGQVSLFYSLSYKRQRI
jgi:hypothetical protein